MAKKIPESEMLGKRFGKLVVLKRGMKKGHNQLWKCQCDCGKTTEVAASSLKSGNTRSCGNCQRIEIGPVYCVYITKKGSRILFDSADLELVSQYIWSENDQGYAQARPTDKSLSPMTMHRLLLNFPAKAVDHKNGNRLDNRRSNLRIVTPTQNVQNSGIRRDSTTGYKGVYFDKNRQKYRVKIVVNGKAKYLGQYRTAEEGGRAYDKAAAFYFGEFARPNFSRKEEETNGREKEQALLEMEKPLVYKRSWRTNPGANALS